MSPKSDNLSYSNPSGRPPGSDNITMNVCTNIVNCAHKSSRITKKRETEREKIDEFSNRTRTYGSTMQSHSCSSTGSQTCGFDSNGIQTRGSTVQFYSCSREGSQTGELVLRTRGDQVDVEQHVPFDSSCYPNGTSAPLYMTLPSSPPRNRTHDRKHQKKN